GSSAFRHRLLRRAAGPDDRVRAADGLSAGDVSRHLQACDLLVQPYPDGVSTRRTSFMAALAHGRPTVTTRGPLTETLWGDCGAAVVVPAGDGPALAAAAAGLLADAPARARLAR